MAYKEENKDKEASAGPFVERKAKLNDIIQARLIFNTLAEAEEVMGMKAKNIKGIKTEDGLRDVAIRIIDHLDGIVDTYQEIEDFYDWWTETIEAIYDNRLWSEDYKTGPQRSTRRWLARWLFLWRYADGVWDFDNKWKELQAELYLKSNTNVIFAAEEFFRKFYDPDEEDESLRVALFVLDAYGFFDATQKRGDRSNSMAALRDLVEDIRREIPALPVMADAPEFDRILRDIDLAESRGESFTIAEAFQRISFLGCSIEMNSNFDELADAKWEYRSYSLRLPGTLVDDEDEGRSRFWVFLAGTAHLLCCRYSEEKKTLAIDVWEEGVWDNEDDDKYLMLITPEGRMKLLEGGHICDTDMVTVVPEPDFGDEGDGPATLYLSPYGSKSFPDWWKITRFSETTGEERERFHRILCEAFEVGTGKKLYIRRPGDYEIDRADSKGLWILKIRSELLGIDRKYVYLHAPRYERIPFSLDYDKETDRYSYEPEREPQEKGLFELTQDDTVYAVPRVLEDARGKNVNDFVDLTRIDQQVFVFTRRDGETGLAVTKACFGEWSKAITLAGNPDEEKRHGVIMIPHAKGFF